MLKLIKFVFATFLIFFGGLFLLSNVSTINYPVRFIFPIIPNYYVLESVSFPLGVLLLIAFCLGMVFSAFMGAFNLFYRGKEIKAKDRTIKELEKELEELRSIYASQRSENVEKSETSSL